MILKNVKLMTLVLCRLSLYVIQDRRNENISEVLCKYTEPKS